MNGLVQDVRFALRRLGKSLRFTLFSVAIMALGIGATTAMFSVIHGVLLRPLEYRDSVRIVLLSKQVTPVRFDEMKVASRSYSALGSYAGVLEQMVLSGAGAPKVLNGARVSANFLQILGTSPLKGRSFLAEEEKHDAPATAMISAKLWHQQFGGDPQIIGKNIVLAGAPHTIIGILPIDFQFPFPALDLWVTKSSELLQISPQSRPLSPTLKVFGRLNPGVTIQRASAELATLKLQYAAAHPGMLDGKPNSPESVLLLKDDLVSDIRSKLWMLFGAVGLVLLIVCANIGSLLLARAASRKREFALRSAIGAGRGHIMRQLLAESMLLASIGGVIGIALAAASLSAIKNMTLIDLPRASEIHMDGMVLAFAVALSTITGVLFGLIPTRMASSVDLAGILRGSSQSTGLPRSKTRVCFGPRDLLAMGQMAVSIILLIGATLLIQSLAQVYRVDPGFQPSNLLTMRIDLSQTRYDTDEKRAAFYEQLVKHVESLPGVRNAAASLTLPFTGWAGVPVQLAASQPMKLNERPISILQLITPEYFRTMEIALKRGREFTAHDSLHAVPVAIINESLARRFSPEYPGGADPIGQNLLMGSNRQPIEIVGITADIHEEGKDQDPAPGLYRPRAQVPNPSAALVVRTDANPLALAAAIQRQILATDPEQPASEIKTMDEVVEASEGELRLMVRLLGGFAGAATLLAMIGLYGVISYSVAQRTREIGIRHALGARRNDILSLVIRQGFVLSAVGITLGVCAAFVLTRILRDLLFHVSPADPATFMGISLLFVLVTLLASYIPARRAAQVDPMVALRYE
ncbi:MAG: ABC transporter permease [Candidatus Sulfotelmatobacter sp.]